MNLTLNPLSVEDIPQMTAIEARQHLVPWSAASFADVLHQGWHNVVLKDAHQAVLGYYIAMTAGDDEELLKITVHPDHVGLGHGKTLMQHLIQSATQRGAARIFLEVRASNHRAIGLYEQLGFKMSGMRKNYYRIPANPRSGSPARLEDACLMCLSLQGTTV